jgi:putative transposase
MLTQKPEDWKFSSYREYLGVELKERICNFKELVALSPREYKKFVEGQIPYQKELALIRTLMLDT